MARADLLMTLIKAANAGDRALLRKAVEAMAAEERAKNHRVLAEELEKQIPTNGNGFRTEYSGTRNAPEVLFEKTPRRTLCDLVLSKQNRRAIDELVQENHRSDLLRSYNLSPRSRLLLTGAPGNGKTSLAEALANALMVPLVVARYDGLITSFLGETASRLRRLFDYAHTRQCVLFFDEFDTLGKERGDIHETGEIKRVVSSLLLQIDDLPWHVVVVCATNHPELLDRAVWRRFQIRLELTRPTNEQIEEYFRNTASKLPFSLGQSPRTLARGLAGASFSELEDFVADVARTYVLSLPSAEPKAIVEEKLRQWNARSGVPTSERQVKGK
jgi:AAA+ superfamily predicted ATPase